MRQTSPLLLVLLTAALAFTSHSADAATIYVDAGAAGSDNGTSWQDAYNDLQQALASAGATDSIWVAAGTYKPTSGTNRSIFFSMVNGITLLGGFDGTETLATQRDPAGNETILSGDIGTPGDDSDNSYHVVYSIGAGFTIDGFTITGGNANGPNPHNWGGGIYFASSPPPTLRNLKVQDNSAASFGGGLMFQFTSVTVENVIFSGNDSGASGGGVTAATGTFVNVVFFNNTATNNGGGGDISGSASLTNCSFSMNHANQGGALHVNASSPSFTNVIVWGNTATNLFPEVSKSGAATPTFSYSLIKDSGGSGGGWDPNNGIDGGNNIDVDPLFVNAAAGDLHLPLVSPAVDAGDDSAPDLPATDLDGNARISGNATDMGAYEAQFTCPPGSVMYVDADAAGANDGSSWTHAYNELSDALFAATFCGGVTEIWVAEGTYKPTASTDRSISFDPNDLLLYGGFDGTETTLEQRDFRNNATVLSGDIGTPSDSSDNSYHVVRVIGAAFTLDGFVVTGGNADGPSPDNLGGGIYFASGLPPTLRNLSIENNSASSFGGGLMFQFTSATVENIIFSGNQSGASGGGVTAATGTFVNVLFVNNTATNNGGGGDISGTASLTNCTFSMNGANQGGALHVNGGSPEFTNVIVWDNTATNLFPEVSKSGAATPTFSYSLIKDSGGSGVGWDSNNGIDGGNNIDTDPLFQDAPGGNYRLQATSPAVNAGNNAAANLPLLDFDGEERISAGTVDMGPFELDLGLEILSILDVGNDQGRHVRVVFAPSTFDAVGSPFPVLQYELHRRQDPLPKGPIHNESSSRPQQLSKRVPGWDFVLAVPAHGDAEYSVIAPTLADSTISAGLHETTFFVRAATAAPLVFFDSNPGSGYSLDNLAPGIPLNLRFVGPAQLSWDESSEPDFDYFTVYGSPTDVLGGSSIVLGYTVTPSLDASGNTLPYIHVTATDFSGNEGEPAAVQFATNVPSRFDGELFVRAYPNPFNPRTTITYSTLRDGAISLALFDVSGRSVATLLEEQFTAAGQHSYQLEPKLASGTYFLKLTTSDGTRTEKITVVK